MFKNKKMLMLLALSSMSNMYGEGIGKSLENKYDKLYEKMTQNMDKGLSNEKNYDLIENILNQRNKELQDLYKQNDYIVKPEFLEWQVFFSGYYQNKERGGKKDKLFETQEQKIKSVDLGIMVPVKGIEKYAVNLELAPLKEPEVNISEKSILSPVAVQPVYTDKKVDLPLEPVVFTPYMNTQNSFSEKTVGSLSVGSAYYTSGYKMYENMNVESVNGTSLVIDGNNNVNVTGAATYSGATSGTTQDSYIHTSFNNNSAVHNIGLDGNYEIKGDWKLTLNNASYDSAFGFLKYYPYFATTDSKTVFSGNLELKGVSDTTAFKRETLIGLSLKLANNNPNSTNKVTLENSGTITIKESSQVGQSAIAMQLESGSKTSAPEGELINSGNIIIEGTTKNVYGSTGGVGIFIAVDETAKPVMVKTGNIAITGDGNRAVELGSSVYGSRDYVSTNINVDGSNGKITLGGNMNVGLLASRALSSTGNSLLDNVSNMDILINGISTYAVMRDTQNPTERNMDLILNSRILKSIEFGENSNQSTMAYVTYGNMILEADLADSVKTVNKGTQNFMIAGGYNSIIKNYMPINIGSGAQGMLGIVTSGRVENYADIINNSSPYVYTYTSPWNGQTTVNNYGGIGIALANYATGANSGNIEMSGNYSTALYNVGTLMESNSDHITVNGNKAIGIYSGSGYGYDNNGVYQILPSQTNVKTDKLELRGDGGALIYTNGGNIQIGASTSGKSMEAVTDGKNSFGLFMKKDTKGNFGTIALTSDIDMTVTNGAIGLYYEGKDPNAASTLVSDLNKNINTENGKLTFNLDQNSYRMYIKNSGVNVSDMENITSGLNIRFIGSDKVKISDSIITVDTDSNLDNNNNTGNKTYKNMEISKSGIQVNEGVTITGTEDGLAGIAQSYNYDDYSIKDSINSGTMNLSGDNSVGIFGKRGNKINNGLIEVSGKNSVGIFSNTGYTTNSGTITVGDHGIGVYADTFIDPEDNPYNYTNGGVYNSGTIIAKEGSNAVGIYSNYNSPEGSYSSINTILENGTNIDVSASKGGVGVYANKAMIQSSGNIKISAGENGVGIYSKSEGVSLYGNTELNLKGDNAVGVYLDNSTGFEGTGTANVDGKGIVVINKVGGQNYYNQNFNVNSTAGSKYILQNIENDSIVYNNSSVLGEGGTFAAGVNSSVVLGTSSSIHSDYSNMAGIALNGIYMENSQEIPYEAVNKGIIEFGDNSTGLYVTNGADAQNEGTISLGNNSAGLYGKGNGSVISNTGTVNIGSSSVGMYLKDGDSISNTGTINSTGDNTAGIYSHSDKDMTVTNEGSITLSGNKSTALYIQGAGQKTVNNRGDLTIGDSLESNDPSAAIFNRSESAVINNYNNITAGKNSIGIYNNKGTINHVSGNITAGEGGTGVYTNSGTVNINSGTLNFSKGTGVYGTNNALVTNSAQLTAGSDSYGFVINNGSSLVNNGSSVMGENSVFLYSDGAESITNTSQASVTMNGSDSVGFYSLNGGTLLNNAAVNADKGTGNIGIYKNGGSLENTGDIKIGDSVITDPANVYLNKYSVGVYGENLQNMKNTGNIKIGEGSVGFYSNSNANEALNTGNISSASKNAIGIFSELGAVRNAGDITLSGDNSIGIAGMRNATVTNAGIITMNGNNSMGIYASSNTKVINEKTGKIYINGNNSTGVQLSGGSVLENHGIIEIASGTINSKDVISGDTAYEIPSIINAGIMKVDEKFELNGFDLIIKPDPSSFRIPTMEEIKMSNYSFDDIKGGFLLSNSVSITAPSFDFGNKAAGIDPYFTQGTNARVYKFENVFDPSTADGGPNSGNVSVKSNSLTFEATPVVNNRGKIDIWMEKINYDKFTKGAWYDEFAKNIEGKYLNATGGALKVYDKLDLITDETILRNSLEAMSGSMYANINQREQDIYGVLDNALETLQNSENNTKENVKVNVIVGKGNTKEKTDGVDSYSYNTAGALVLREVERTYKHKFGYSAGYTNTNFRMDDTDNKDEANTLQLGLHNKYSTGGWNFKNDLLGSVSFHAGERSITWYDKSKSDFKSEYNVYGINSKNRIEKEYDLGKSVKVTPYTGLDLGYMTHEGFKEKGGAESLELESNNGYSVKPNIGVRLEGEKALGKGTEWKIKGNIELGYEYELGNMTKQERGSVSLLEEGYHKLSQPSEDKGKIKTGGMLGVELQDRYGIFLTGEYGTGSGNKSEYKAGVSFKASF